MKTMRFLSEFMFKFTKKTSLIGLSFYSLILLNACVSKPINKSSHNNPSSNDKPVIMAINSVIAIPQTCIDPTQQFLPKKSIITRLSYNEKAHPFQPVGGKKGFISHDFNLDGKMDYIFMERKHGQNSLRLTQCVSANKNSYQRRPLSLAIHEEKGADFQTIYESVLVKKGLLEVSINRHEHNWGSDSEISLYQFDTKANQFMLINRQIFSSSGDGMRGDSEEWYDLQTKRFQTRYVCGPQEDGCQSSNKKGRFIPLAKALPLYHSGKVYQKLLINK